MGTIVSEIIFSVIEGVVILLFHTLIIDSKDFIFKNKLKSFIYIFMYTFLSTWPANLLPKGIHTIFLIASASVLLSIITRANLYASAISTTLSVILFFLTEIIFVLIPTQILSIDLNAILEQGFYRIIFGYIIKFVQLGLALAMMRLNIKLKKLSEFKKMDSLYSLLVLQSLMITLIIFVFILVPEYKQNMLKYNLFLAVTYIIFLILVFFDFRKRDRLQAIQYKFQAQEEHIANMETIINIIRKEKHDFSNHLNTILAICVLNKPDTVQKIESYVRKYTDNLKTSYHFFNSGNDFIDGLLVVKSNVAFEHGIHFEADFEKLLENLDIKDTDLTSIISNLVDNALDAILSTGECEGKIISIVAYEEDSNYYLSVSNNGPKILEKDIQKIFDNGYSTKSKTKAERGFGLYIVQQLVQRNNGTISVTSDEYETEFLIKFEGRGENIGKSRKQNHKANMPEQSKFNSTAG